MNNRENSSWSKPLRSMTRRAFLHRTALATAGLALTACQAPGKPAGTPATDSLQLVYQDWRTDWFPPMVQRMLADFHAGHPNIRVFYTPDPENFQPQMLADMQAGTAADVLQGCCSHFPTWAQMGHLLDLRPYVEADLDSETIADWDPAQVQALFLPDGRQFGLPKYHGALALYYNKDLFDLHGVDYPDSTWDHEDYRLAMNQLTHDRSGDGQIDLWGSMMDLSWDRIQVHVNAWGGHLVDPMDNTRSRMADPEALDAFEWIRSVMWDDRVMATPLDVQNRQTREAFVAQQVAMVEDGSWALKDILSGARFRVGVAPMPRGPARRATLATTDGFAIYARTNHPDEAWELVKFLIGKDYGRAMARANFLQPARASLLDDWAGYIRAEFPQATRDLDIAAFAAGHVEGYSVTAEVFANMAEATRLATAAWEEIFILGRAPVELMEEASRQIEAAQKVGS